MTSLVIRVVTMDDIPSIVKIRIGAITAEELRGFAASEFSIYSSTEKLTKNWDEENRLADGLSVYIAEDEGKIVGFIVFKVKDNYGYIDNIMVSKEAQRKGVGTALVAHIEDIAQARGCSIMKTDTTENAEGVPWKAYRFWITIEYKDTGERLSTNYDFKEIPLVKHFK